MATVTTVQHDWHPPSDPAMDPSARQRSPDQQQPSPQPNQSPQAHPSPSYPYPQPQQLLQQGHSSSSPLQQHQPQQLPTQQPPGQWTPSPNAQPFYPSFQPFFGAAPSHFSQPGPPPNNPYFDPAAAANAQAQFAQWAYQQMIFNAQQQQLAAAQQIGPGPGPAISHSPNPTPPFSPTFAAYNNNGFPSGTPPPHPPHPSQSPSPSSASQTGRSTTPQQQPQGAADQHGGYHPYRRPQRAGSAQTSPVVPFPQDQWGAAHAHAPMPIGETFQPPYARSDAAGSSSSVNSTGSSRSGRQRTNSDRGSAAGSVRGQPSQASSKTHSQQWPNHPGPNAGKGTNASAPSINGRPPHQRAGSSSSSTASHGSAIRAPVTSVSMSTPTVSVVSPAGSNAPSNSSASAPISSSSTSATLPKAVPRPAKPSPLSQGSLAPSPAHSDMASRRMSRDDSDLAMLARQQQRDVAAHPNPARPGKLKDRLKRVLGTAAPIGVVRDGPLKEDDSEAEDGLKTPKGKETFNPTTPSAASISSSTSSTTTNQPPPPSRTAPISEGVYHPSSTEDSSPPDTPTDGVRVLPMPAPNTLKKTRSLFNRKLNASTDNISLSSTVSSASMMIRKLGSMAKLTRRNSLAGITSLFKDKDKDRDRPDSGGEEVDEPGANGSKSGKKKKKDKKGKKGAVAPASVSYSTAELDREGSGSGQSEAAALARQYTLRAKSQEAARERAEKERVERERAEREAQMKAQTETVLPGPWEKNTATRQGIGAGGSMQIREDGMRVLVEEDEDESGSEDGTYDGHKQRNGIEQPQQSVRTWQHEDDDEEDDRWREVEEDVTIRVGLENVGLGDDADELYEPWAVGLRRSFERARAPSRGILKNAMQFNQEIYLEHPNGGPLVRHRSNSETHAGHSSELGPLARMPSPDPSHVDGLRRHPSSSSQRVPSEDKNIITPTTSSSGSVSFLPPLSFETSEPETILASPQPHHGEAPLSANNNNNRSSAIFNHPALNSSAPALSTMLAPPPALQHRSATTPAKRLSFAANLSIYDTFPAAVYDRRSEPATWSRLTPALAQRIKEELNSYKMEEMEVHTASRIHTQFFV